MDAYFGPGGTRLCCLLLPPIDMQASPKPDGFQHGQGQYPDLLISEPANNGQWRLVPPMLSIGAGLGRRKGNSIDDPSQMGELMRYTLFLYWPEPAAGELDQAEIEAGQAAFHAYARELNDAGVLISAEVLQPTASATTLTLKHGTLRVRDGPFAEAKEHIGGIFVLELPDLDAALAWAEQCPSAGWGTVEIRPSAIRVVDGLWVGAG